jgi:TPR repeat protein
MFSFFSNVLKNNMNQNSADLLTEAQAKSGDAEAQVKLGIAYAHRVPADYVTALPWFEKAAKQGHAGGQFCCGSIYLGNVGVPQDYTKAFYWLEQSARNGNVAAQFQLGTLYYNGVGIPVNYPMALFWFEKAALQGKLMAYYYLGCINLGVEGVPENYAKAFSCFTEAVKEENASAQLQLATLYYNGTGVVVNYPMAFFWLEKAAQQGNLDAQVFLATLYANGQGTPKNYSKALFWLENAAEKGNIAAKKNIPLIQNNLGAAYRDGKGVTQDDANAVLLFEKSASQGFTAACFSLANMYRMGRGIPQNSNNLNVAISWFQKAAVDIEAIKTKYWNNDSADGCFAIGWLYEYGHVLPKNLVEAAKWYEKAFTLKGLTPTETPLSKSVYDRIKLSKNVSTSIVEKESVEVNARTSTGQSVIRSGVNNNVAVSSNSNNSITNEFTKLSLSDTFLVPYHTLKLGERLGEGAYGVVFKATQGYETVAVKQLTMDVEDAAAIDAFLSEAQHMSQLHSDYTVRLKGMCEKPYCLILEFMAGGSLYGYLKKNQPSAVMWLQRIQIALDMSYGLAYLHSKHVIHRDLKSLNVLLDDRSRAKLSDFGLTTTKASSSSAAKTKSACGTTAWMAPELLDPHIDEYKYDEKTDIFAYGMVLYELSSHQVPFQGLKEGQISEKIRNDKRPEIPASTPDAYTKLILDSWDKTPASRPNIDEAINRLNNLKQITEINNKAPEYPSMFTK